MLASAFVTYFFISHSKFKLPRLYFNSSAACSLLLCTTLPRSWRSRRSQGTAAWQGGPRAPHTVPGCSVAQELLTPWSTHKAWEEDATRCHSLLGSCFSQGCKLWSFLPIIWLWLLRNHPFSPGFLQPSFDAQAEALARDSQGGYSCGEQRDTCPLVTSLTEWCWGWEEGGDECQRTLSTSESYRIIFSVTQPGSCIQGMQKLLHIWIDWERACTQIYSHLLSPPNYKGTRIIAFSP